MGRRYFYAIVDETHRSIAERGRASVGSWDGADRDPFWRKQQEERRRAAMS